LIAMFSYLLVEQVPRGIQTSTTLLHRQWPTCQLSILMITRPTNVSALISANNTW